MQDFRHQQYVRGRGYEGGTSAVPRATLPKQKDPLTLDPSCEAFFFRLFRVSGIAFQGYRVLEFRV